MTYAEVMGVHANLNAGLVDDNGPGLAFTAPTATSTQRLSSSRVPLQRWRLERDKPHRSQHQDGSAVYRL